MQPRGRRRQRTWNNNTEAEYSSIPIPPPPTSNNRRSSASPTNHEDEEDYSTTVLRTIFLHYCTRGLRPTEHTIESSKFRKLALEAPNFLDSWIGLVDVDLAYAQARGHIRRRLDFERFLEALLLLAWKKYPEEDEMVAFSRLLAESFFLLPCAPEHAKTRARAFARHRLIEQQQQQNPQSLLHSLDEKLLQDVIINPPEVTTENNYPPPPASIVLSNFFKKSFKRLATRLAHQALVSWRLQASTVAFNQRLLRRLDTILLRNLNACTTSCFHKWKESSRYYQSATQKALTLYKVSTIRTYFTKWNDRNKSTRKVLQTLLILNQHKRFRQLQHRFSHWKTANKLLKVQHAKIIAHQRHAVLKILGISHRVNEKLVLFSFLTWKNVMLKLDSAHLLCKIMSKHITLYSFCKWKLFMKNVLKGFEIMTTIFKQRERYVKHRVFTHLYYYHQQQQQYQNNIINVSNAHNQYLYGIVRHKRLEMLSQAFTVLKESRNNANILISMLKRNLQGQKLIYFMKWIKETKHRRMTLEKIVVRMKSTATMSKCRSFTTWKLYRRCQHPYKSVFKRLLLNTTTVIKRHYWNRWLLFENPAPLKKVLRLYRLKLLQTGWNQFKSRCYMYQQLRAYCHTVGRDKVRKVLVKISKKEVSMAFQKWKEMSIDYKTLQNQMSQDTAVFCQRLCHMHHHLVLKFLQNRFQKWVYQTQKVKRTHYLVHKTINRLQSNNRHQLEVALYTWKHYDTLVVAHHHDKTHAACILVAEKLRRFRLTMRMMAFKKWKHQTDTRFKVRRILTIICKGSISRAKVFAFFKWKADTRLLHHALSVLQNHFTKHFRMIYTVSLLKWKEYCSRQQIEHQRIFRSMLSTVKYYTSASIQRAFTKWKTTATAVEFQKRNVMKKLWTNYKYRVASVTLRAFHKWKNTAEVLNVRQKFHSSTLLRKVMTRFISNSKTSSFNVWKLSVQKCQLFEKSRLSRRYDTLHHFFIKWSQLSTSKSHRRRIMKRVLNRCLRLQLRRAFSTWFHCFKGLDNHIRVLHIERREKKRIALVLQVFFIRWKSWFKLSQVKVSYKSDNQYLIMKRVLGTRRAFMREKLQRGFHTWHQVIQTSVFSTQVKKKTMVIQLKNYSQRRLCQAFKKWQRYSKGLIMLERLLGRIRRRNLHWGFNTFVTECRNLGHEFKLRSIKQNFKLRLLLGTGVLTSKLSKAFSKWKLVSEAQRKIAHTLEILLCRVSSTKLHRCFRHWKNDVATYRRRLLFNLKFCNERLVQQKLGTFLTKWKVFTQVYTVKQVLLTQQLVKVRQSDAINALFRIAARHGVTEVAFKIWKARTVLYVLLLKAISRKFVAKWKEVICREKQALKLLNSVSLQWRFRVLVLALGRWRFQSQILPASLPVVVVASEQIVESPPPVMSEQTRTLHRTLYRWKSNTTVRICENIIEAYIKHCLKLSQESERVGLALEDAMGQHWKHVFHLQLRHSVVLFKCYRRESLSKAFSTLLGFSLVNRQKQNLRKILEQNQRKVDTREKKAAVLIEHFLAKLVASRRFTRFLNRWKSVVLYKKNRRFNERQGRLSRHSTISKIHSRLTALYDRNTAVAFKLLRDHSGRNQLLSLEKNLKRSVRDTRVRLAVVCLGRIHKRNLQKIAWSVIKKAVIVKQSIKNSLLTIFRKKIRYEERHDVIRALRKWNLYILSIKTLLIKRSAVSCILNRRHNKSLSNATKNALRIWKNATLTSRLVSRKTLLKDQYVSRRVQFYSTKCKTICFNEWKNFVKRRKCKLIILSHLLKKQARAAYVYSFTCWKDAYVCHHHLTLRRYNALFILQKRLVLMAQYEVGQRFALWKFGTTTSVARERIILEKFELRNSRLKVLVGVLQNVVTRRYFTSFTAWKEQIVKRALCQKTLHRLLTSLAAKNARCKLSSTIYRWRFQTLLSVFSQNISKLQVSKADFESERKLYRAQNLKNALKRIRSVSKNRQRFSAFTKWKVMTTVLSTTTSSVLTYYQKHRNRRIMQNCFSLWKRRPFTKNLDELYVVENRLLKQVSVAQWTSLVLQRKKKKIALKLVIKNLMHHIILSTQKAFTKWKNQSKQRVVDVQHEHVLEYVQLMQNRIEKMKSVLIMQKLYSRFHLTSQQALSSAFTHWWYNIGVERDFVFLKRRHSVVRKKLSTSILLKVVRIQHIRVMASAFNTLVKHSVVTQVKQFFVKRTNQQYLPHVLNKLGSKSVLLRQNNALNRLKTQKYKNFVAKVLCNRWRVLLVRRGFTLWKELRFTVECSTMTNVIPPVQSNDVSTQSHNVKTVETSTTATEQRDNSTQSFVTECLDTSTMTKPTLHDASIQCMPPPLITTESSTMTATEAKPELCEVGLQSHVIETVETSTSTTSAELRDASMQSSCVETVETSMTTETTDLLCDAITQCTVESSDSGTMTTIDDTQSDDTGIQSHAVFSSTRSNATTIDANIHNNNIITAETSTMTIAEEKPLSFDISTQSHSVVVKAVESSTNTEEKPISRDVSIQSHNVLETVETSTMTMEKRPKSHDADTQYNIAKTTETSTMTISEKDNRPTLHDANTQSDNMESTTETSTMTIDTRPKLQDANTQSHNIAHTTETSTMTLDTRPKLHDANTQSDNNMENTTETSTMTIDKPLVCDAITQSNVPAFDCSTMTIEKEATVSDAHTQYQVVQVLDSGTMTIEEDKRHDVCDASIQSYVIETADTSTMTTEEDQRTTTAFHDAQCSTEDSPAVCDAATQYHRRRTIDTSTNTHQPPLTNATMTQCTVSSFDSGTMTCNPILRDTSLQCVADTTESSIMTCNPILRDTSLQCTIVVETSDTSTTMTQVPPFPESYCKKKLLVLACKKLCNIQVSKAMRVWKNRKQQKVSSSKFIGATHLAHKIRYYVLIKPYYAQWKKLQRQLKLCEKYFNQWKRFKDDVLLLVLRKVANLFVSYQSLYYPFQKWKKLQFLYKILTKITTGACNRRKREAMFKWRVAIISHKLTLKLHSFVLQKNWIKRQNPKSTLTLSLASSWKWKRYISHVWDKRIKSLSFKIAVLNLEGIQRLKIERAFYHWRNKSTTAKIANKFHKWRITALLCKLSRMLDTQVLLCMAKDEADFFKSLSETQRSQVLKERQKFELI